MDYSSIKNLTKNIILATGLTAIALTGIGCENTDSHSSHHHKGERPPARAGYSSQASKEYVQKQKKEDKYKEKPQWPPHYGRAGYSSQSNEEYNKRNGIGQHKHEYEVGN
jgi:hypothetical protein